MSGATSINWSHAAALMLGSLYHRLVDGQRLVSNGHVLLLDGDADDPSCPIRDVKFRQQESIEKLWRYAQRVPADRAISLGLCSGKGVNLCRQFGTLWIAERFVRLFPDNATWTYAAEKGFAIVHLDGAPIGLVMPHGKPPSESLVDPATISDAEVYGWFACEQNGWYLLDGPALDQEIAKAVARLQEAEDELEKAEWKVEAAREHLNSLYARRAAGA